MKDPILLTPITQYIYSTLKQFNTDMSREGMPEAWEDYKEMAVVCKELSLVEKSIIEYAKKEFGDILSVKARKVQRDQENSLVTQGLDNKVYHFAIGKTREVTDSYYKRLKKLITIISDTE